MENGYFINKFWDTSTLNCYDDSGADFKLKTNDTFEFYISDSKKHIKVKAQISSGKIILTEGYFFRNDIHRFRNKTKGDVNKSYYDMRRELFKNGYIIEEDVIKYETLNKFTTDKTYYTIFRIEKEIEFESIVMATSTIYGTWVSKKQCFRFWKRNGLNLQRYVSNEVKV